MPDPAHPGRCVTFEVGDAVKLINPSSTVIWTIKALNDGHVWLKPWGRTRVWATVTPHRITTVIDA